MFKKIIYRNLSLYLVVILIFAPLVNWQQCFQQRGKFLLGIFYNGHFQNANDGRIYQDYLKRHKMTHDEFWKKISSTTI